MKPILFYLGSFPIYAYGFMICLGFLAGLLVAQSRFHKEGLKAELAFDFVLLALVSGLVGARLFFVIQYPQYFQSFKDIFMLSRGGLVFYGGLLLCIPTMAFYCRYKKLPMLKIFDILAMAVIIGLSFARIGCFYNGCCYGLACPRSSFLSVHFPADSIVGRHVYFQNLNLAALGNRYLDHQDGKPFVLSNKQKVLSDLEKALPNPLHDQIFQSVYPTQLLGAVKGILVFLLLGAFYPYRRYDGEGVLFFGILYSVGRFMVEMLRGDTPFVIAGLTAGQAVSVCLFCFCMGLFLYFRWVKSILGVH